MILEFGPFSLYLLHQTEIEGTYIFDFISIGCLWPPIYLFNLTLGGYKILGIKLENKEKGEKN